MEKIHAVKLPRRRRKAAVEWLMKCRPIDRQDPPREPPIRVVCISDTHNTQPFLPPGEVLIHAGDLTENGSFEEVQAQLNWLSSQPHPHKVWIAGNHDVLLDDTFLKKHPERRYGDPRTKDDLDWGNLHYLENQAIQLSITRGGTTRQLNLFGSPLTPSYGVSAFQYPRDVDPWERAVPCNTDILITHGPAFTHLDTWDFHHAGCQYLGAELARVRPRLAVFGHIHGAYGREDIVLDRTRQIYEEVMGDWAGWPAIIEMLVRICLGRVCWLVLGRKGWNGKTTTFVNAAMVGGAGNKLRNEPIAVEL